jgi:pimeloyl-ACP methyl ester carboxylesterase
MKRWEDTVSVKGTILLGVLVGVGLCLPAAAAETKHIDVNGTTLAYVEQGQGVPVVLVHGALGDYRTWSGEMDDFSAKYHVVAYSYRYHYPDKRTDGEYSYQVHIADLVALLQALKLGPVHLVGHSAGGLVVANVAKDHPELVRGLVLAEPSLNALVANKDEAKPSLADVGKVGKAAGGFVQKGEPDQGAITFFNYLNEPSGGFKGLPVLYQTVTLDNASTLKPFISIPPPPPFTCDDAKKINVTTLLMAGELTQPFRHLVLDELQRCMPNTERAKIPHASHPLEMINPKDFNATTLQFLEKH